MPCENKPLTFDLERLLSDFHGKRSDRIDYVYCSGCNGTTCHVKQETVEVCSRCAKEVTYATVV